MMKKLLLFVVLLIAAKTTYACSTTVSVTKVNDSTFIFTANTKGGNTGMTYDWSFYSGTPLTGTGATITHAFRYSNNGYGALLTYSGSGCTDSVFIQVPPNMPNKITGTLYRYPQANTTSTYKVWLIDYNATAGTLTAVDSVNVTMSPSTNAAFEFNNKPAATYLVKAAEDGASPSVIPTYSFNSAYWSGATPVVHTGGYSVNSWIGLIAGTPGSGPGFIGGSISSGANRVGRTTGNAAGMVVLLRNSAGDPIAFTKTDANGGYSFSNIATGTYSIYPEEGGYTTTVANATITTAAATVNNLNFHVNTTAKTIAPSPSAVANIAVASTLSVYPNPTTGVINIEGLQKGLNNVTVTDVAGRMVLQTAINYISGASVVDLSAASAGVYFISIKADGMNYTNKLILQH